MQYKRYILIFALIIFHDLVCSICEAADMYYIKRGLGQNAFVLDIFKRVNRISADHWKFELIKIDKTNDNYELHNLEYKYETDGAKKCQVEVDKCMAVRVCDHEMYKEQPARLKLERILKGSMDGCTGSDKINWRQIENFLVIDNHKKLFSDPAGNACYDQAIITIPEKLSEIDSGPRVTRFKNKKHKIVFLKINTSSLSSYFAENHFVWTYPLKVVVLPSLGPENNEISMLNDIKKLIDGLLEADRYGSVYVDILGFADNQDTEITDRNFKINKIYSMARALGWYVKLSNSFIGNSNIKYCIHYFSNVLSHKDIGDYNYSDERINSPYASMDLGDFRRSYNRRVEIIIGRKRNPHYLLNIKKALKTSSRQMNNEKIESYRNYLDLADQKPYGLDDIFNVFSKIEDINKNCGCAQTP